MEYQAPEMPGCSRSEPPLPRPCRQSARRQRHSQSQGAHGLVTARPLVGTFDLGAGPDTDPHDNDKGHDKHDHQRHIM